MLNLVDGMEYQLTFTIDAQEPRLAGLSICGSNFAQVPQSGVRKSDSMDGCEHGQTCTFHLPVNRRSTIIKTVKELYRARHLMQQGWSHRFGTRACGHAMSVVISLAHLGAVVTERHTPALYRANGCYSNCDSRLISCIEHKDCLGSSDLLHRVCAGGGLLTRHLLFMGS